MFPIVDAEGVAKPAIQVIVEEAIDSGIEQVCLVVQAEDVPLLRGYFGDPLGGGLRGRLSGRPEAMSQAEKVRDLGRRLDYVVQECQEGYGHAVHCAKDWVGGAPFLLMLGDHIYRSHTAANCARQVLETYDQLRQSVFALARTPGYKVSRYGAATGVPLPQRPGTYRLSAVREKPSLEYARTHLRVEGLGEDEYLCMFGQYVLTPALFDYLGYHIDRDLRQRGEIQLTGALEMLRQEEGAYGIETAGERYDIGTPLEYVRALVEFSSLGTNPPDQP